MDTKKCTKCGKVKRVDEFGKHRLHSDGLTSSCKKCESKQSMIYRRSKRGLVFSIHSHQRHKSKKRNHPQPTYSNKELLEWCNSQKFFHELYDKWKISGYNKKKTPSIDRINDYLPYTMDNIQLVTWDENNKKAHFDRKNGINNKFNKSVIAIDKNTGEEFEFHSMCEAERQTGAPQQSISACCLKKPHHNTSKGFIWKFKTEKV